MQNLEHKSVITWNKSNFFSIIITIYFRIIMLIIEFRKKNVKMSIIYIHAEAKKTDT